jgi:NitT/TauT family transport system substrate-binding protein
MQSGVTGVNERSDQKHMTLAGVEHSRAHVDPLHGAADGCCVRGGACKVAGWFVVVAALLVAAGIWKAVDLRNPPPAPLRVALNPWPGYEFATLAQVKGYFEQEGVEVRLLELGSLGECRRAFERGQADGFFGTVIEVLQADAKVRHSAEIVSVIDYSDGADCILARAGITAVSQLRGKRIAVEHSSINVLVLARALELSGLEWSSVSVVYMSAMQMPAAFAAGSVDAVVTYPPMSIEILRAGPASRIFSTAQIPGEVVDVLAFDPKVLGERRAEVDAFLRAFFRAQEYAAANREEAYSVMAARQRLTAAEFGAALTQGIRLIDRDQQREFFGPGGSLEATVRQSRRILEMAGQLHPDGLLRADAQAQEGGE